MRLPGAVPDSARTRSAWASVRNAVRRTGGVPAPNTETSASSWLMKTFAETGVESRAAAIATGISAPARRTPRGRGSLKEIAEGKGELIDTGVGLVRDLLIVELDAHVENRFVDRAEGPDPNIVGGVGGERCRLHERARIRIARPLPRNASLRVEGFEPHEWDDRRRSLPPAEEKIPSGLGV